MKTAIFVLLGIIIGVTGVVVLGSTSQQGQLPLLPGPTPSPTADPWSAAIPSAPYAVEVRGLVTPIAASEQAWANLPEVEPVAMLHSAPVARTASTQAGASSERPVWAAGHVRTIHYNGWQRYAPTYYCAGCPSVFERRFMPVPLRYEGARGYIVDFGAREDPAPWSLHHTLSLERVSSATWQSSRTYHVAGVILPEQDECAEESFRWLHQRLDDAQETPVETYYSEAHDHEPAEVSSDLTRLKILTGPRSSYPVYLWDKSGASLNELMVASGYALAMPGSGGVEGRYSRAQRYAQVSEAGCLW